MPEPLAPLADSRIPRVNGVHTTHPSRLTSSFFCWSSTATVWHLIGKSSSYHVDCTQNPLEPLQAHAFYVMVFGTSCIMYRSCCAPVL
jgi:hypothetical protein